MKFTGFFFMAISVALFLSCTAEKPEIVDTEATAETKALFREMQKKRQKGIMLAHQDDLAYGYKHYSRDGFSDIQQITGSFPPVVGWELGHLELGSEFNLDSVYFSDMKRWIRETHERGGINTISWHGDNIASGHDAWDCAQDTVVCSVLPGGKHHAQFQTWLDRLADFFHDLKDSSGKPIPVIFRMYHEHTGSWFWWGAKQCTPDEYNRLYRMTVSYLRDVKNVHNLLYAFSPADVANEKEYFERYPGDDWVDILGFDCYFYTDGTEQSLENYRQKMTAGLKIVTSYSEAHNKIPIMAETGMEGVVDKEYFTKILYPLIEPYKISYVLLWRNAWNRPDHFYVPYKGHPAEQDFIEFLNKSKIIF